MLLEAPPIVPQLEDDLERFLTKPEQIPVHDLDRVQRFASDCIVFFRSLGIIAVHKICQ